MKSDLLGKGRAAVIVKRLAGDEDGGVLVEATVMMTILFAFVLGAVDFLFAYYDWNAASKAVQIGARIAAVSNPVANGLNSLSVNAGIASGAPGTTQMPSFTVTCDGSSSSCTCSGNCTGYGTYDSAAMQTIVYGRGNSGSCNNETSIYFAGMCNMYPGLTPANVRIVYTQTGLGYAGRPGGPVPTVQVSLQGLNFQYYFVAGLVSGFGSGSTPMGPDATWPTTVTGEALCSSAQSLTGPNPSC